MPRRDNLDSSDSLRTCPECDGAGLVPDPRNEERMIPCPMCAGSGRVTRETASREAVSGYRKKQAKARRAAVKASVRDQKNAAERDLKRHSEAPSRALREARKGNVEEE